MLYEGHLVIADSFLRSRLSHRQTIIEKPLYSGRFYSGHLLNWTLFLSIAWKFWAKFTSLQWTPYWLVGKKKKPGCFYLAHFFTLTWFNFSRLFFTYVISLASPLKNSLQIFQVPSQRHNCLSFQSSLKWRIECTGGEII